LTSSRPKGRGFLLRDAHVRAQEYSVRNLYPDHGAYRTPCTAILLFQACSTFRTTGA
jgi:hypothetical protein